MTDEDIVKALGELELYDGFQPKIKILIHNAIYLINSQKDEIKRLNMDNKEINILINMQEKNIREQQEIIDTLIILNKSAKSEAIKDFAERLKERTDNPSKSIFDVYEYYGETIDDLVKEMTEVQE